MGSMSIWHWAIVIVVVAVLFGGRGKLSSIMGDAAKGIRAFKDGLSDDGKKDAPSGNPFVCDPCDGPEEDVRARLKAHTDEGLKRFWWGARPEWDQATFIKSYGNPESPRKK